MLTLFHRTTYILYKSLLTTKPRDAALSHMLLVVTYEVCVLYSDLIGEMETSKLSKSLVN